MIHINLLPVRQIRERLKTRNEVAIYLASLALVAMSLSMIAMTKISAVEELKGENVVLAKKKASYEPILKEIAKLKKNKKTQETKLNVIKKLKVGAGIAVHVMDELATITPTNRLWLKNMTLAAGKNLSVSGVALDNATIAQFMNNIAKSSYFKHATLSKTSQTVVSGAKLKSFSLTIGVVTPGEPEKGKKKKKKKGKK